MLLNCSKQILLHWLLLRNRRCRCRCCLVIAVIFVLLSLAKIVLIWVINRINICHYLCIFRSFIIFFDGIFVLLKHINTHFIFLFCRSCTFSFKLEYFILVENNHLDLISMWIQWLSLSWRAWRSFSTCTVAFKSWYDALWSSYSWWFRSWFGLYRPTSAFVDDSYFLLIRLKCHITWSLLWFAFDSFHALIWQHWFLFNFDELCFAVATVLEHLVSWNILSTLCSIF